MNVQTICIDDLRSITGDIQNMLDNNRLEDLKNMLPQYKRKHNDECLSKIPKKKAHFKKIIHDFLLLTDVSWIV